MKKIVLFSFILFAATIILPAQETKKDSLALEECHPIDSIVNRPSSPNSDLSVSDVKVHLDFDIPFYNKIKNRNFHSLEPGSLGIGMLSTDAKSPFDFNPSSSLEIFLYGTDEFWHSGRHSFSAGPGISWKNFTMTGGTAMSKNTASEILTGPYPEGSVPKLSRLRVFSFSFPILYSCNVSHGFGFTLGPVVNLNTSSVINTKYRINGDKRKDKYKQVHCNVATVDLMFQLNLKDVSLYVKYSPMDLMDKAYWPSFQQWSFGIAL